MANSADPDQLASQLIWIYTVCKNRAYLGSAGLGLNLCTELYFYEVAQKYVNFISLLKSY